MGTLLQRKANATKTMHSQAVKYISAEIQKCSLGESLSLWALIRIVPQQLQKLLLVLVNTMTDKNPYNAADNAVVSSGSSVVAGQGRY